MCRKNIIVALKNENPIEIWIYKSKESISGAPWGSKTATVKWKGDF